MRESRSINRTVGRLKANFLDTGGKRENEAGDVVNAHDSISEAVSKVLAGHESRNPWQNCSCGWRGPTITLSSQERKRLFQKHVADSVAESLIKRTRTISFERE